MVDATAFLSHTLQLILIEHAATISLHDVILSTETPVQPRQSGTLRDKIGHGVHCTSPIVTY